MNKSFFYIYDGFFITCSGSSGFIIIPTPRVRLNIFTINSV